MSGKGTYVFSPYERRVGRVSRDVWYKMLKIAHELDLNKGGICDARSGAINLWVSPEDKPSDYIWEITKGALNYPREYLAGLYGQFVDENTVELYLEITNYARMDEARERFKRGEISWMEFKEIVDLAERGTDEEWRWTMEKVNWLIEQAKAESVFKEIVYCPFCGREFPELKLFNEFVEHIASHVKVKAVIMGGDGWLIETEKGTLTPEDYTKTIKG